MKFDDYRWFQHAAFAKRKASTKAESFGLVPDANSEARLAWHCFLLAFTSNCAAKSDASFVKASPIQDWVTKPGRVDDEATP